MKLVNIYWFEICLSARICQKNMLKTYHWRKWVLMNWNMPSEKSSRCDPTIHTWKYPKILSINVKGASWKIMCDYSEVAFRAADLRLNKYDLKDLSTPVFLPGGPRDGGAWLAAIYGVAQSRTQLKWLGSKGSLAEGLFYSVHSFDFFTLYFTFLLVNSKKNHEFSCSK